MSETFSEDEVKVRTQAHPRESNLVGPTGCWSNTAYSNKSDTHYSRP